MSAGRLAGMILVVVGGAHGVVLSQIVHGRPVYLNGLIPSPSWRRRQVRRLPAPNE